MLRKIIAPALAATLVLAACDKAAEPTAPSVQEDYALVMFGEMGSSLEGTLGPQDTDRPFDGRTYRRAPFPDSIALSQVQKDSIAALRAAFRAAHAPQLDSLAAIFAEARAAREAGATREEVRAILATAWPIALLIRVDLVDLHYAIWSVFTPEQKAWVIAHRPLRMPTPFSPTRTP